MLQWFKVLRNDFRSGLNFINVLRTVFKLADPESVKIYLWLYFFTLFGYTSVKAVLKTLMKLTLDLWWKLQKYNKAIFIISLSFSIQLVVCKFKGVVNWYENNFSLRSNTQQIELIDNLKCFIFVFQFDCVLAPLDQVAAWISSDGRKQIYFDGDDSSVHACKCYRVNMFNTVTFPFPTNIVWN